MPHREPPPDGKREGGLGGPGREEDRPSSHLGPPLWCTLLTPSRAREARLRIAPWASQDETR
eukprot:3594498-Alexandrium_andersonii.AAC.1